MKRDLKNCWRSVFACSVLVLALIMPTTIGQAQSGQGIPFISDPNQRTFALTAQLRSYGDPDQKNVLGALVLRLSQAVGAPDDFNAIGLAHLLQIEEPYIGGRPNIDSRNTTFFRLATTISSSPSIHFVCV